MLVVAALLPAALWAPARVVGRSTNTARMIAPSPRELQSITVDKIVEVRIFPEFVQRPRVADLLVCARARSR